MDKNAANLHVEILIKDILIQESPEPRWEDWFGGLALDTVAPGCTRLSGVLADRAALHGVLERIRDFNLKIISLQVKDHLPGAEG